MRSTRHCTIATYTRGGNLEAREREEELGALQLETVKLNSGDNVDHHEEQDVAVAAGMPLLLSLIHI